MIFSKKKKNGAVYEGEVFEFHEGKYRCRITLTTPDGRWSKLEGETDFPDQASAAAELRAKLNFIIQDAVENCGAEVKSSFESETMPPQTVPTPPVPEKKQ